MIDFLFINSPNNMNSSFPPFYFMYLAAYLKRHGFKCRIVDRCNLVTIAKILSELKARFVGLASFHSDYNMTMTLGKMVKERQPWPETTLLVGNAHATISPEDFLFWSSPFDIAVMGEGEKTCLELAGIEQELMEGGVKGIAYMGQGAGEVTTKLVKTEPRPFMDLKDLPMPRYDMIDLDWYLRPQKQIIRRIYTRCMPVYAGRGCYFNCDFCAANVVWKANEGKCARLRPVENVINEILILRRKFGADFVYIADDMFGVNKKWMDEWFKKYRRVFPPYACQTRADVITEDMVRGLKETGCIQIDIGVESGSRKLRYGVNKKITNEQIEQAFEWCRKYKIRSFATMMINLPGEDHIDLEMTADLLDKIKPSAGVTFAVATPFPGTKLYEKVAPLDKEDYHLLNDNAIKPNERFRMSDHRYDLKDLRNKLSRKYKSIPLFERMWAMRPFQKGYWFSVFVVTDYTRKYFWAMLKDLPRTFLSYWKYL